MTALVLITALVLHLTGLWSHIPASSRVKLGVAARPADIHPVAGLSSLPVPVASPAPLQLETGSSAYAVDVASGQVLFAQNATTPRPIASITKLMTVMVALSAHQPSDVVTVGKLPSYDQADETMGLIEGEKFHLVDLIKAALIPSDNDAADALAIATSGNLTSFYAAMNARTTQWGITGAHFASASGLSDTGNMVSAAAVAKIAELDLTSPTIKTIVNTQSATISDLSGRSFNLTTTDDLLASGKFYGIKTGYTQSSGECFVGLTTVNGHQVITVVLGATDRFAATGTLVNWIGSNYTWL